MELFVFSPRQRSRRLLLWNGLREPHCMKQYSRADFRIPESVTLNSPTPQFTEIAQPQAPFHPGVLRIRPQASLRPPQSCLSPPLQHSIPHLASRLAPSGRAATQAPWGLLPRLVGSACLRARLRPPRRPHRADANGARTPQRPRHWPPGPAPTGGRGGSRGRP